MRLVCFIKAKLQHFLDCKIRLCRNAAFLHKYPEKTGNKSAELLIKDSYI